MTSAEFNDSDHIPLVVPMDGPSLFDRDPNSDGSISSDEALIPQNYFWEDDRAGLVIESADADNISRMQRLYRTAKRSGQTAVVMAALLPLTNEGSRVAIYGATEAMTRHPGAGAAALGLSTFVIESVGGLAAASVFETKASDKVFNTINEKGKKLGIPTDRKLSTATKVGITFMGGTTVGMALEQREDPRRTVTQNRRFALISSTWQAGALGLVGAAGSEGINVTMEDPKQALMIGGIIAGTVAIGSSFKKRVAPKLKKVFGSKSKSQPEDNE
ncbi:hypothetical protein BH09PAT3_BH09PAT3_2410 [soil metagenome]